MRISRLIAWITLLGVFAMAARLSMDTDTWWHLRAGEWILEQRAIPQVDPFSYTRLGERWQYPGWLAEVPMALIYRRLGPGGLNLWTAAMVTLAFVCLWRTLSGGAFLRALITILAAAVSGVYWAARPYLVTFLLAAIFLSLLENYHWRRSPQAGRRLAWLPVLMVIWANSHGGFIVGFILYGVYWLAESWQGLRQGTLWTEYAAGWRNLRRQSVTLEVEAEREPTLEFRGEGSDESRKAPITWLRYARMRLLRYARNDLSGHLFFTLVGIALLVAVCLSPAGPRMLLYPFQTVSIGALQDYIQEWQSPNFHLLSAQPFLWLLLLTLAAVGAAGRRMALSDFLLVAGFAYLGFLAGRNLALFALAAPPALSRHAAPLLEELGQRWNIRLNLDRKPKRFQARLNGLILALVLLAVGAKAWTVFPAEVNDKHFRETLPVEAVEWILQNHPPGRLFNSYNYGAYLLWALPGYPVFIDGRTDLYNDEIIEQWLQVVRAEEGWQQTLDHWQVNLVLLEPNYPLSRELQSGVPGWQLLYADERAVVWGR